MACEKELQALNNALAALGQWAMDGEALIANAEAAQAVYDACIGVVPPGPGKKKVAPKRNAKRVASRKRKRI